MIDKIYIENQHGEELEFRVEKETPYLYEVFRDFGVTHIDKSLVYKVVENGKEKWKYPKRIHIPEDMDKPDRDYFVWGVLT